MLDAIRHICNAKKGRAIGTALVVSSFRLGMWKVGGKGQGEKPGGDWYLLDPKLHNWLEALTKSLSSLHRQKTHHRVEKPIARLGAIQGEHKSFSGSFGSAIECNGHLPDRAVKLVIDLAEALLMFLMKETGIRSRNKNMCHILLYNTVYIYIYDGTL